MTTDRVHRDQSGKTATALFLLVLCCEIYLIAGRSVDLPRTPLTADSFLVDGLTRGVSVTQTMTIMAGGFNEVVFSVAPIGEVHVGKLNWSLHEIQRIADGATTRTEDRLLFRDVVHARAVLEAGELLLRFPVVNESRGRAYRLDIWPVDARSQSGVGLWATDGSWTDGGSMFVNGLSGYSEFVFEARATRVTVLDSLRHHFSGIGFAAFLLFAVCAHGAVFVVFRALAASFPADSTVS